MALSSASAVPTTINMVSMKDGDSHGDGFPLTVFQPASLYSGADISLPSAVHGDVSTLETIADFSQYIDILKRTGYYVPINWIWGI